MLRTLHRWPGLFAMIIVIVLALSGAALSVFTAVERFAAPQVETELSVAELARRIQTVYPGVEQIKRAPTGRITAYWFTDGTPGSAVIDPATGREIASADPNSFERWLTNLHRSLFLGDAGRIVMAAGAFAMLLLALSGIFLVARRVGGWKRWLARLRGPLSGRVHVEIARVTFAGLLLSSATALWMSASTFELLPAQNALTSNIAEVSGETGIALNAIQLLSQSQVSELHELSFPAHDDATDVFTLNTSKGTATLDQGTGALLTWSETTAMEQISETVSMLHTGKGAAVLGLILGLMVLGVPVMAVTGLVLWFSARRGQPKITSNAKASRAQTIILVGSEGGSTWGFAATLHKALVEQGQTVHTAAMSSFEPARYTNAKRILILAATYGEGDAPASAKGFLARLSTKNRVPLAILGFGDSGFPAYCAFAHSVAQKAGAKGWPMLMPLDTVNRQSPQDFARWGRSLGAALKIRLELAHTPLVPASHSISLISRRDYGFEVQAPTAILRFALPKASFWQRLMGRGLGNFQAGDLLGILPRGSAVPRFYSLASESGNGFIEIVVRKQPGGLCSGQLVDLQPGSTVTAFVRPNPSFHAGREQSPLILIGAGTGIAPFAGFVRSNLKRRPIHLFFGIRHPGSDLLYGGELARWKSDGRLARMVTATSRGARPHYIQDVLRSEAVQVARLVKGGARVMVCGGREMAAGVREALTDILAPVGLSMVGLKAEGRYVEDVY